MTAGDGDAEQLRVPRWIGRPPELSEDDQDYGGTEPELPVRGDDKAEDLGGDEPDDFDARIYVPRRYSSDDAEDEPPDLFPRDEDDDFSIGWTRRVARREVQSSGGFAGKARRERDDGRRRASDGDGLWHRGRRRAVASRSRPVLVAWLAASVVAVALPLGVLFYSSGGDANVANGQPSLAPPAAGGQPTVAIPSIPGSVGATASPSEGAGPGRSDAPEQFGPATYEAEANANTLGGSASVTDYPDASGGRIVRNIGDWGIGSVPGTLRFENVDAPVAGSYTLTFFHVNIDNERTRTAVITVDGVDPILVTIAGNATCCVSTAIKVTLNEGRNTIAFSNNSSHAPSIDKITISRP